MNGRLITGIIAGGIAGAAVGLLFAPRSGKETRRVLRDKAEDGIIAFRERFGKNRRKGAKLPLAS